MATKTVFFGKLLQSADLPKEQSILRSLKAQMLNTLRGSGQILEPEACVQVQETWTQDQKEENFLSGTLISRPGAWIRTGFLCRFSSVFRRICPGNGSASHTGGS